MTREDWERIQATNVTAVFLASDRASFMVGSIVMADGGMTVTAG